MIIHRGLVVSSTTSSSIATATTAATATVISTAMSTAIVVSILSIHLERSTWSESKKFGSSRESLILEKDTWNSIRTEALRERERLEYSRDKLGRSVERERDLNTRETNLEEQEIRAPA